MKMANVSKLRHMTTAERRDFVPDISLKYRLMISRLEAGMHQSDLAAAIGAARSTIANYEAGKETRRSTVMAWAMATGVDLHWLETGTSPSPEDGGGVSEPSSIPRLNNIAEVIALRRFDLADAS